MTNAITTAQQKLKDISSYPDTRNNKEPKVLTEWRSNQHFIDYSHANYRFTSELVYVHFDFTDFDKLKTTPKNILNDDSKLKIDIQGNYKDYFGKLLSQNTLDISIPGQSQNYQKQNIMNVVKNYSNGLGIGTKNEAKFKIIESNNIHISRFINYLIYLNHNPDNHRMNVYPDTLKFKIYVYPLIYDADFGGIFTFNTKKTAIILDGCQIMGFDDWDFDISGSKSGVVMKNVNINYEKMYLESLV